MITTPQEDDPLAVAVAVLENSKSLKWTCFYCSPTKIFGIAAAELVGEEEEEEEEDSCAVSL